VVCFEKNAQVGGIWYRRPQDAGDMKVFDEMKLTISLKLMSFSDFRVEDRIFASRHEYMQYLEVYADRFSLRKHIRFNTAVDDVRQAGGIRRTPHHGLGSWAPKIILCKNVTFVPHILNGKIQVNESGIADIEGSTVYFKDHTIKEYDSIVPCTGFEHDFSLLLPSHRPALHAGRGQSLDHERGASPEGSTSACSSSWPRRCCRPTRIPRIRSSCALRMAAVLRSDRGEASMSHGLRSRAFIGGEFVDPPQDP
jgi:hypothetical protein